MPPKADEEAFKSIYNKYCTQECMTKQDFKCAFIFYFGMKPSKEDIMIAKEFVRESTQGDEFKMDQ